MKIEDIEGIGKVYADKLRAAGVRTTDALLDNGATRKGRDMLAQSAGVAGSQIMEWVNRADLYRIKGIGSEFSDLLEKVGVDTVMELAQRNAANLAAAVRSAAGTGTNVVRRVPGEKQMEGWIKQAKKLPRKVGY